MITFVKHLFKLQFLVIILAVLVGIYYNQIVQWILNRGTQSSSELHESSSDQLSNALFTKQQLAQYNGESGAPIYLALLGNVYDVSKGIKHYGPGCSYNYFVGRDASVSFITGEFEQYDEEQADDVVELKLNDLLSLENWKRFYDKEYTYKGKLIGRFYDATGAPMPYYYKYVALLEQAETAKAQAEHLRALYPGCNIEWSSETGSHVWCTTTSGGVERQWIGHPRKLFELGANSFRCVCVREEELDTTEVMLKEYDGCARLEHHCYYNVD